MPRDFYISFIKEKLNEFNSLSSEQLDTVPYEILAAIAKFLSLLFMSILPKIK